MKKVSFAMLFYCSYLCSQILDPHTFNLSDINSKPIVDSEIPKFGDLKVDLLSSIERYISIHNKLENQVINGTKLFKLEEFRTITTRQIPKAGELYKKNVSGIVVLLSVDATSMGTGSLINDNGEIITNWHVVEGSDQMAVFFYSPKYSEPKDLDSYEMANVIAIDPTRDLALLKLKSKPKTESLKLASASTCRVAQDVFAIGHPDGLLWSFTYGVISQLRNKYEWQYSSDYRLCANVIQTQTPSNPGCSGGPLFNDSGELIGLNSFSVEGQGLNFAIRVDEISDFIQRAKKGEFTVKDIQKKHKEQNTIGGLEIWKPIDKDNNGKIDAYKADLNKNGFYEIFIIDENEDNIKDYIIFDSNEDYKADGILYDKDNNGTFEYLIADTDFDGEFDTVGVDTDGDFKPDVTFAYTGD